MWAGSSPSGPSFALPASLWRHRWGSGPDGVSPGAFDTFVVMDLGVCMAAKIDDIDYAVLAEELGFSHVWVADSQMIWSGV